MAGRGPAPKDADSRRRRNSSPEMTVLSGDGQLRGPDLPEGFVWPAATVEWWAVWRRSGQAQTFTETDWSFLLDTAVLHAEFWLGDRSVASEVRLRAAKFGATPEDRARLKLEVGKPTGSAPRLPESAGRRERLLKAVGDAAEA